MATNISLVGSVVRITDGAAQPIDYVGVKGSYSFNAAGTILNLNLGGVSTYAIPFDDLEVGGAAPADVDAAYTALSTVFPNEGGGSGSTPNIDTVLAVVPATLTEDRTVDLDGNVFKIEQDGNALIDITPADFTSTFQQSDIANNLSGGIQAKSQNGGDVSAKLFAKSGANEPNIFIDAVTNSIGYTATGHSFSGNVFMDKILNLAVFANASPADGDIWREDNTNSGLKIRINGVTKTITVS